MKTPKFNETLKTQASLRTSSITDNADVRVFPSVHPQSEVHISVDRFSANHLIASANTYIYGSGNGYHQGYYYSLDGGASWQGNDILQNTYGEEYGDPSTAYSADSRAYISTMRPADGYYLQSSTNAGVTWGNLNIALDEHGFDKDMIVVDNEPSSPYVNRYYAAWTHLITGSNIVVEFQRSLDNGNTFSAPITLKNGKGFGTNVQTGPNGEVYVCWADYNASAEENPVGLGFTRSLDGGTTFSNFTRVFDYVGTGGINTNLNNIDYHALPAMAVDKSNSSHRGRIYVTYPTKENGNGKLIIQVRYSDNQGTTWSAPATVNIPSGRQNFMPWIAVDNCTGEIWVVYYSFDTASGFETNTYVALSVDGGVTWENQKVSDVSHTTAPIDNTLFRTGYCGDYIGITAHGGRANPIWHDNRNGTWQLYTSMVSSSAINSTISGSNSFCSNATYTLNNLPSGYSILSWQTTPSTAATVSSSNGNTVTVVKNQGGTFSLTANIGKCGASIPITVPNLYADPSTLSTDVQVSGDNAFCNDSNPYTVTNLPPGSTVQWQASPQGIVIINSPNSPQTTLSRYSNGVVTLTAIISNACGTPTSRQKTSIQVGTINQWNQVIYDLDLLLHVQAHCSIRVSTIRVGQILNGASLAGLRKTTLYMEDRHPLILLFTLLDITSSKPKSHHIVAIYPMAAQTKK